MKKEIQIPSLGESITTGVISFWKVNNGDQVKEGDIIFELETDKAAVDIPSPASGTLEILVKEGTEVQIGQTVATVTSGQEAPPPVAAEPAQPEPPTPPTPAAPSGEPVQEQPKQPAPAPVPSVEPPEEQPQRERRTERVPMSIIRQKTAQRLVQATQSSAYLTTFNEIDMKKIIDIRTHYKEQFQKSHNVKIGFMSFFVKACCLALKEFPAVNTQVDGNDLIYKHFYDIGVAVSIDEGLVVPVIKSADTQHFAEIEVTIADLSQRARDKKLLPGELTGGTFTITNGGVFGSLLSTPIPAYPQTAILGMHAIKKRPIVIDDQILIRPMMYVALTYDHRAIDGRDAVKFLARVKEFIEEPDKLLLEL